MLPAAGDGPPLYFTVGTRRAEPWPFTLNDLTVNFSHQDRALILLDWRWLVGPDRHPILITALGDAFLQDSRDSSIHLLSCGAATVDSVRPDPQEFERRS